jgi:hypothetical protein
VVLGCALNKACRSESVTSYSEISSSRHHNTSVSPKSYANCLAEVCDSEKGGDTVTGVVILQHPSNIQYVIASNQRSQNKLDQTKSFVTSLLKLLKENSQQDHGPGSASPKPRVEVLRSIIDFNSSRLSLYALWISKHTEACIDSGKGSCK